LSANSFSRKILLYWHDALVAERFDDIDLSGNDYKVTLNEIVDGKISEELAAKLFIDDEEDSFGSKLETFRRAANAETKELLDVVLALYPFRRRREDRKQKKNSPV